jgi:hypothetical protein
MKSFIRDFRTNELAKIAATVLHERYKQKFTVEIAGNASRLFAEHDERFLSVQYKKALIAETQIITETFLVMKGVKEISC